MGGAGAGGGAAGGVGAGGGAGAGRWGSGWFLEPAVVRAVAVPARVAVLVPVAEVRAAVARVVWGQAAVVAQTAS